MNACAGKRLDPGRKSPESMGFEGGLRRKIVGQTRENGFFSIMLLDIDHFKYVNDTYGHLTGDAVLTEAAQRIKGCIRPYDTLGRYGGEEFLIVLPTADGPGAVCVAERIREAFESRPFVTETRSRLP